MDPFNQPKSLIKGFSFFLINYFLYIKTLIYLKEYGSKFCYYGVIVPNNCKPNLWGYRCIRVVLEWSKCNIKQLNVQEDAGLKWRGSIQSSKKLQLCWSNKNACKPFTHGNVYFALIKCLRYNSTGFWFTKSPKRKNAFV